MQFFHSFEIRKLQLVQNPFKTFSFVSFSAAWKGEHATYCGTNGSVGTILINFYRERIWEDRRALRHKRSPTIARRWRCISFLFTNTTFGLVYSLSFPKNACFEAPIFHYFVRLPRDCIWPVFYFSLESVTFVQYDNHVLFSTLCKLYGRKRKRYLLKSIYLTYTVMLNYFTFRVVFKILSNNVIIVCNSMIQVNMNVAIQQHNVCHSPWAQWAFRIDRGRSRLLMSLTLSGSQLIRLRTASASRSVPFITIQRPHGWQMVIPRLRVPVSLAKVDATLNK